jgi:hypothetical protein
MRNNRKTIFCDIDGTIFWHHDDLYSIVTFVPKLLPGVINKILEWRQKDYYIVLTTARPEGCRSITQKQLDRHGIFYDQLIMGLPVGPRVIINDKKPDGMITADSVCVDRNIGLESVEV